MLQERENCYNNRKMKLHHIETRQLMTTFEVESLEDKILKKEKMMLRKLKNQLNKTFIKIIQY